MITPYLFQLQDVRRIHRMGGKCLLANEQGLGKTGCALLYAQRHPSSWPMMVVCPSTAKYVWEREALLHINTHAEVLEGTSPPKHGLPKKPKLVVINYDILHAWLPYLTSLRPGLIVFDECHYIAHRGSRRAKAARKLCAGVPGLLALSGTPLTNRPYELYNVLNLLRADLFPSFFTYAQRYCGARLMPWGRWNYNGATHLDELHEILTKHLMIRRLKKDVLHELPPKQIEVVPLALPASAMREYREANINFLRWLRKTSPGKLAGALRSEALSKVGELKRLIAHLKLPLVMNWIDDFLASGDEKLIVFVVHTKIIDELCVKYKGMCVKIDGSVSSANRQKAVDVFQQDKKCRLFFGNIQAAGSAITLTASCNVVFPELSWKPADHAQASDRAHRIGQDHHTFIHYLVARDTLEQKWMKVLQDKQSIITAVLDGGESSDAKLFDSFLEALAREGD